MRPRPRRRTGPRDGLGGVPHLNMTSFKTPRVNPHETTMDDHRVSQGQPHTGSCLGQDTVSTLDGFPSDLADFWPEAINPPAFLQGRTPHGARWSHRTETRHHGSKTEPRTP